MSVKQSLFAEYRAFGRIWAFSIYSQIYLLYMQCAYMIVQLHSRRMNGSTTI